MSKRNGKRKPAAKAKAKAPSKKTKSVARTAKPKTAPPRKGVASAKTNAAGKRTAAKVTKAAESKKPVAEKKAVAAKVAGKQKAEGKKMTARAKASSIVLPAGYRPSEDEPFMNARQRVYFKNKLLDWKEEILRQTRETLAGLHEEPMQHADLADRATSETDRALELRARDRQRKLVAKIDAALARIEDGTYGYCEETGEPIGLRRLDARPIATLSLEAQERHERRERVYRED